MKPLASHRSSIHRPTHTATRLAVLTIAIAALLLAAGPAWAQAPLEVSQGATVIPRGATFDMGSTPVGVDTTRTFTIENVGSTSVAVGTLSYSNNTNNPGSYSASNLNYGTLAPGETGTFDLTYSSTGPGTVQTEVRLFVGGIPDYTFYVETTAVGAPTIGLTMGTSSPGNITLSPGSSVPIAQAPQGTTLSRVFTVTNGGDGPLSLGSLSLGPGISTVGSVPSTVAAGSSATFTLQFSTSTIGSFAGTIALPHDAPGTANPFSFEIRWSVGDPPPVIRLQRGTTVIPEDGTWNYGSVQVGGSKSETFRIYNDGSAPLTVGTVSIGGNVNNPGSFSVQSTSLSNIPVGSYGTVTLRYDATATGQTTSDIRLFIGGTPQFRWYVTATGTEPIGPVLRLQLGGNVITDGETIDFGQTGPGQDLTRTFTAYNDGDQPLSATVSVSGNTGDPSSFVVDQNNVANVAPGASATFVLRFDAGSQGTVTSNIRLFVGGTVQRSFYARGTVAPPDFQLSAGPSSRTVNPGQNAFYTATVDALYGWNQSVALSASGLPAGVTASFTPTSVTGAGTSQMQLSTSGSTPSGTHPITITGSGGGRTRTASVNLIVNQSGDVSLSVTPSTRSVNPGGSTTYTVSASASGGFSSNLSLSVLGLPGGAGGSFAPSTIGPNGTSTLTVTTSGSTPLGDSTLTIRATGGGLTRNRTVTLSVVDGGPAGAPIIDSITPEEFQNSLRTVTVYGANLQGSTVRVPTAQPDPNNPVGRIFPTAVVTSINAAGTQMQVQIDARDDRIIDFYNLEVDNGVDIEAVPFRVLPAGPLVDLWTPSQPQRGGVYVLTLAGRNLQGAAVSVTPAAGVRLFSLDTSAGDRVTGLLEVDENTALGPRELVVTKSGRQIRLPITITTGGPSQRQTRNLTNGPDAEDQMIESGSTSTEARPDVFFEEMTLRLPQTTEVLADGLKIHEPDESTFQASTVAAFDFELYIRITIPLVSFNYQRTLLFDPVTGQIGDAILQGLNVGNNRRIGSFVLSFFLDVDLTIYFRLTNQGFTFPLFCLEVEIGLEIPGFRGEYLQYNYCIGGQFVQFASGSTNGIDLGGGDCAEVTPEGPPVEGFVFAEVEQTECCEQPISASSTGVSLFGGSFNITEGEVGRTTPSQTCGTPPADPQRYDIEVRAFIPYDNVLGGPLDVCCSTGLPILACTPSDVQPYRFIGDDRSFSPNPPPRLGAESFRISQEVSVYADNASCQGCDPTTGEATGTARDRSGRSSRYGEDALFNLPFGEITIADRDGIPDDCHLWDRDAFENPDNWTINVTSLDSETVVVDFNARGVNPLAVVAPAIDWDFTVTIEEAADPPKFTINARHDCFPAYEIYINGQQVYGDLPPTDSPVYIGACLLPPMDVNFTCSGRIGQPATGCIFF